MRLGWVTCVLAAVLAGACVAPTQQTPPRCSSVSTGTGHHLIEFGELDPRQPFDVLITTWDVSPNGTASELNATVPAGWSWEALELPNPNETGFLAGFRFVPPGNGAPGEPISLGFHYARRVVH